MLCLLLAGAAALSRVFLASRVSAGGESVSEELLGVIPKALSLSRRLFWAAVALAVAGCFCGVYALSAQKVQNVQNLAGQKLVVRGQVLDYPLEQYHRYYYKLQVVGLGEEEGPVEEVEPFTLRLSASMPLVCEPYDTVECAVTFYAFDQGGGLYSTYSSRLADGYQAGGYLSQYEGIVVETSQALAPGKLLAELRRQVGRELDRALPRREAGLLKAMVLGDGSGISQEDMGHFRQLGVSHILVVSGLHMTVLAAFLQFFLKRFPIRRRWETCLQPCACSSFCCLPGSSPPPPGALSCTACSFWRIPSAAGPTESTPWGWRCCWSVPGIPLPAGTWALPFQ